MRNLNYWQRLEMLKMYSLERRRERYLIIYTWKIINDHAPNFKDPKYKIKARVSNERHGIKCVIPKINSRAPSSAKSLKEQTFAVQGPRLFNALPVPTNLRNYMGTPETFKNRLDKFLMSIPDKPSLPGYHQNAVNNSIVHHRHA